MLSHDSEPEQADGSKTIPFSRRLVSIMTLASVVQEATPALGSDASKNLAENIEKSIHSQATSEDEYDHRCAEAIEDFQQRTSTPKEIKAEPTTDDLNEDGPSLGSYVQVTFHKTGLFSTIFKALAPNSFSPTSHSAKQYVALKVTTPSAMIPPHDSKREVRILEESRSERIIPLLAKIWQPGDRLVLAFPFMPFDLDVMMRDQEIETRNVNGMIRDIFQGLSHLHDLGIIHRDVKPSNLLLKSRQGPAYLADFGIAWSPQDSKSEPAQQKITDVGTTSYRAPEVLFGFAAYGTELDLWAAGCTVAQILRPGHQALFTAGDLGSELALIKSIFSNLGTPNEIKWPSAKQCPDWGKVKFVDYPSKPWSEILLHVAPVAVDFVQRLVQYESGWRMTASEALKHDLLSDCPRGGA